MIRAISTLLLLSAVSAGCGDSRIPSAPRRLSPLSAYSDSISAFLINQGVPKPQEVHVIIANSDSEIVIFRLFYGDPHYDLAGNWYDIAFGIRYASKIGWVYPPRDISDTKMYAPASSDSFLFSATTLSVLESTPEIDGWLYWNAFLPMLASGGEVPESTLLAIADQLDTYISPHVASLLIENPVVQNSRPILTLLSNLPVFQGDEYTSTRAIARQLLNALPPE